MSRTLTRLALAAMCLTTTLALANPFTPYLTRRAPVIVRDMGTEIKDGVELHRVVFASRITQTPAGPVPTEIYCVIARPTPKGKYPGLLILHGGGGSAEEALAIDWAKRGFVAVSPDLPGIANPAKVPNSTGAWKTGAYGVNHFMAVPDATHADIFDGELSAIQSLYLLRAQPDVDTHKIGVTGTSWGGYSTIMVASLAGHDVDAAFAIYGSGHYDAGSTYNDGFKKLPPGAAAEWERELDAKNYTAGITADFVEAAATNDVFFYPPSVAETLADIHGHKNQVFAPNISHWMSVPGGTEHTAPGVPHSNGWMYMQVTYFEYMLKGIGQPLPEIHAATATTSGDTQTVTFEVQGAVGATTARVYSSPKGPAWKDRKWTEAPATLKNGAYTAQIPANTEWFASASDARPVTVTTPIEPLLANGHPGTRANGR